MSININLTQAILMPLLIQTTSEKEDDKERVEKVSPIIISEELQPVWQANFILHEVEDTRDFRLLREKNMSETLNRFNANRYLTEKDRKWAIELVKKPFEFTETAMFKNSITIPDGNRLSMVYTKRKKDGELQLSIFASTYSKAYSLFKEYLTKLKIVFSDIAGFGQIDISGRTQVVKLLVHLVARKQFDALVLEMIQSRSFKEFTKSMPTRMKIDYLKNLTAKNEKESKDKSETEELRGLLQKVLDPSFDLKRLKPKYGSWESSEIPSPKESIFETITAEITFESRYSVWYGDSYFGRPSIEPI